MGGVWLVVGMGGVWLVVGMGGVWLVVGIGWGVRLVLSMRLETLVDKSSFNGLLGESDGG